MLTCDHRFLDAFFHAVDGNFSQVKKDKYTDPDDVPLTRGAAYYVNEDDTKKYMKNVPASKFVEVCEPRLIHVYTSHV